MKGSITTTVAFILIGLTSVRGLNLRINKESVVPAVTRDVQILCHEDDPGEGSELKEIVLMFTRDDATPAVPVASINSSQSYHPKAFIQDVGVYGYIGQGQTSFLLLVWSEASFSTPGTYHCQTFRTSISQPDLLMEESPKQTILQSLDKFCDKFHGPIYSFRNKNAASLFQRIKGYLGNETGGIEAKLDKWFSKIDRRLSQLLKAHGKERKSKDLPQPRTGKQWPTGKYGLLQTNAGCPANAGFSWVKGYFKHHTESSQLGPNRDQIFGKNFAEPVLGKVANNNFFFTRYCSKRVNSTGPLWPKGHYCINRIGRRCPIRFKSGYTFLDNENDDNSQADFKGPDGHAGRIYYCCREDGNVTKPISLPTDHPFFLYRFGGECQAVSGMKVSSQWLFLDTENTRNGDKYQNQYHPDGQAKNGVKIQTCYYYNPKQKRTTPPRPPL